MSTQPMQATPPGTELFKPKILSFNLPRGADPTTTTFPLANRENDSLGLAARERFDVMCANILWGSEDHEAFGEMLRSLVVSFLPQNVFQLHLLRNIASAQWQLQRIEAIQHNLFDAGKDTVGAYKLPGGTSDAMEFQGASSNLLRDLQRAISTFRSAKKG